MEPNASTDSANCSVLVLRHHSWEMSADSVKGDLNNIEIRIVKAHGHKCHPRPSFTAPSPDHSAHYARSLSLSHSQFISASMQSSPLGGCERYGTTMSSAKASKLREFAPSWWFEADGRPL
jgi:hypothetical protein